MAQMEIIIYFLNFFLIFWFVDHFWVLIPDIMLVMIFEFLVDWVKHAFITKFNEIPSEVNCDLFLTSQQCIKAPCVAATLESSGVEIVVFFRSRIDVAIAVNLLSFIISQCTRNSCNHSLIIGFIHKNLDNFSLGQTDLSWIIFTVQSVTDCQC